MFRTVSSRHPLPAISLYLSETGLAAAVVVSCARHNSFKRGCEKTKREKKTTSSYLDPASPSPLTCFIQNTFSPSTHFQKGKTGNPLDTMLPHHRTTKELQTTTPQKQERKENTPHHSDDAIMTSLSLFLFCSVFCFHVLSFVVWSDGLKESLLVFFAPSSLPFPSFKSLFEA